MLMSMPPTLNEPFEARILAGIFSPYPHTDDPAVHQLPHAQQDIQVIFHIDDKVAKDAYTEALSRAICSGNILTAGSTGTHRRPVIEAVDVL